MSSKPHKPSYQDFFIRLLLLSDIVAGMCLPALPALFIYLFIYACMAGFVSTISLLYFFSKYCVGNGLPTSLAHQCSPLPKCSLILPGAQPLHLSLMPLPGSSCKLSETTNGSGLCSPWSSSHSNSHVPVSPP